MTGPAAEKAPGGLGFQGTSAEGGVKRFAMESLVAPSPSASTSFSSAISVPICEPHPLHKRCHRPLAYMMRSVAARTGGLRAS